MNKVVSLLGDENISKLKELLSLHQELDHEAKFDKLEINELTSDDTLELQGVFFTQLNKNKNGDCLRLRIRIKDNILDVRELYLLVLNKKTGSQILDFLIFLSKEHNLSQFKISNVKHDNMDYFAYNRNMKQENVYSKLGDFSYNYILDL